MFKEFKDFVFKGNMIDMAIGIILGGAFGLVVKSLVDNVLMPFVASIFKLPDFSQMFYALDGKTYNTLAELEAAAAPAIKHGVFINDFINLLIVGLSLFVVVKYVVGAVQKEAAEEVEELSTDQELLTEIRDLLKKGN